MITWGRFYWPGYLAFTAFAFGIPELYALFTNVRNTLSWFSWDELHVLPSAPMEFYHTLSWYFSLAGWLGFVVIITLHIWWAGP